MNLKNKILLAVLFIFTLSSSLAEGEALFGNEYNNGWFGALAIKATSIDASTDMMTGARIGWILNHSFVFSGGFYLLTSTSNPPQATREHYRDRELRLSLYYWGAEFEYILRPESLFHFSTRAFIGTGNIGYIDQYDNDFNITDGVYIFEPGLNGTLNITEWFRVRAGVSYRMVTDTSLFGLSDSNMSGISGDISFMFGRF